MLDTNILISAAARPNNAAGKIIEAWFEHRYTLLTSEFQLDEFRRVSRYERIKQFLPAHRAGAMVNELRSRAMILRPLSIPQVSRDPDDNYILAIAVSGNANYLVSRDRLDVLALQAYEQVRIVTVEAMFRLLYE